MKKETMEALVEAAEVHGVEAKGRDRYSGRGMFGGTTCGVEIDSTSHLAGLAAQAAYSLCVAGKNDEAGRLITEMLRSTMDQMGRGVIVY